MIGCEICGLVSEETAADRSGDRRCPRCDSELHQRKPHSVALTWGLWLAGLMLYVPATVLPVMHTVAFGNAGDGSDSTILSGIIDFWTSGAWGIALVIFIASIVIPSTKFIALAVVLLNVGRDRRSRPVGLIRVYRLLKLIGYWSMLDVFVVALVTAVVRYPGLSEAEPRLGILFFGLVVVLTMLATLSFDPRLLWDRGSRMDAQHG